MSIDPDLLYNGFQIGRIGGTMPGSMKTILLVEDEALIALQESRQLREAGYGVIHSLTGEGALEIVDANQGGIDLILMDIDLGKGIDGTEAAERILRKNDIPVLFLSSHMEPEIVQKTERITNYGYVVKSSVFTVLDASIKMALKLFAAKRQLDLNSMEIETANDELEASLENLHRTHEKLLLSEDKFSKAFHLNPDSININRLSDGVYMDINEGFTRIMGYTREDVIGKSSLPGELGIWVRQEDRRRLVKGLLEDGEVSNLEAEFRKKDGTTTVGLMSARIIDIEGQKCIISIARDMGDWKRAQRELAETEQKFRSAFENSPTGISLTALDGRLRTVNHAFCDMLGYSMLEINAMDYDSLTHPDDRESNREMSRMLIEGERKTVHFMKRYIHRDGHTVWADINIALVRDADGEPDFFISHVMDITARKAIEEELSLKSALLDNAGDSIQAVDLEGNIVYVNDTLCRITGYKKHEILGGNVASLRTPDGRQFPKAILDDVVRTGSARFRAFQPRKDGSAFPIDVNCVLEPTGGKIVLFVARDITEQKKIEDAFEKTQALLKSTLDSQKDIYIVCIDKDFKCLYANKAYREIKRRTLGLEIEEGACLLDNIPIDIFLKDYVSNFRRALAGEAVRAVETYESLGMTIESLYNPMYSAGGEIIGVTSFAIDMTEKRNDERRIEYEQYLNEALMDAIPDTIYYKDTQGRFIRVNKAQYEKAGLSSADALIGKTDFDIFARESAEASYEDEREIIATGKPLIDRGERKVWSDGSVAWYSATKVPFFDEKKNIVGIIGISRDITEHVMMENALRESESRWRSIITASPDGIVEMLYDGTILFASEKCGSLFGYDDVKESVGKNILGYVDPSDRSRAMENISKILSGEKRGDNVFLARKKDGTAISIEINSERLPSGIDNPPRIISIVRDVSERRRREEELAESRQKYLDLLNSIGEGFCYLDADEVFRMANPAAESVFGVEPASLVGKPLYDFFDEEGRKIGEKEIESRRKGLSTIHIAPIIRVDGERRWLQVNASPLKDRTGEFMGSTVIFRDITDELKARESLNRLVKNKEMLMKELEHRVKNSLTLVSSLLGIAMHELADEKAVGVFEDTISRIQSMSAIYERLYLAESVESIDFGTYVDGLAKSIFRTFYAEMSPISLVVEVEHIEIDTKRAISLGLILNELLTNALKYAFPDDRSGVINVVFRATEGKISLTVSDNGVGMPDPHIPDSSPSMGMTLIRLLADQIGAVMTAELSHGTALSITFKP